MYMKTMIISDFKAKCIATLKAVEQTGEPVTVTWRGKPIAEVDPVPRGGGRMLGAQRGYLTIKGDIIRSDFADEWAMCGGEK